MKENLGFSLVRTLGSSAGFLVFPIDTKVLPSQISRLYKFLSPSCVPISPLEQEEKGS